MERRDLLKTGAWLGGALLLPQAGVVAAPRRRFPAGFLWGAATAAYQVEGAVGQDGRGPSIWDRFSHTPGKVKNGDTGDVACDSYNRTAEDIALMQRLGLKSYRFSIAWPRIQPTGSGAPNQKGLDHYSRFTDALLKAGIRPLPTLYHWDLPQALEDAGGWPSRDMVGRFADYAAIMGRSLGDRIRNWAMFNEPMAFLSLGYWDGVHAPGRKDPASFLRAVHVVNLAHSAAVRAMRSGNAGLKFGGAFNVSPIIPGSDSAADQAAAQRFDKFTNLIFAGTTMTGQYPRGLFPADRQEALLGWQAGDEKLLREPLDFAGINYYSPMTATEDKTETDIPGLETKARWSFVPDNDRYQRTDMDWIVYPRGIRMILNRMNQVFGGTPIEITENGAAFNDGPDASGRIRDARRVAYYRDHLAAVADAIADGVPVRGYHAWSLLDNFEWAEGYSQRFGLVHVDFKDGQKRRIKDSGLWYAKYVRAAYPG
ncbi:GH1 family beta-glucosidase [Sandaracinobacteroides saxicola]|uniref:Beta-glucosidase n=1 Tax=Sandaracinobacteroides saxicola TaxID=2759707 RepID=A0A7G5IM43_9SPHN|nr:GH1 family beta-glucosidase [Sandaracinobacteroides saxicola]QMW24435.1 beta-glucosidase [Sandaracinobacteroides saxicola]